VLSKHQPCFDGFSQPNFVGTYDATRQRVLAGKQRRLHLVRIEINLSVDEGRAERFD
jgi:hypothetical protein